jgi:signal peptide peptidase SppA
LFGDRQTAYNDIQDALTKAANDPGIKRINLNIDSPGGRVRGCAETAAMIKNINKPIEAFVSECCSGAYWLASQTDKIYATSDTVRIGSIGVATTLLDDSELLKKEGLKRYIITSNDAPKKWADITNTEVRKDIQQNINDTHAVFVKHVAAGRNTTIENVNENYGQGGILIASKALTAGMIDGIIDYNITNTKDDTKEQKSSASQGAKNITGGKIMTLDELKATHQELYASVLDEGKKISAESEVTRINALLTWEDNHPNCKGIVREAITKRQTVQDVFPMLLSVSQGGSNADAFQDNPGDIQTADPTNAAAGGGDTEDKNVQAQINLAAKAFEAGR